MRKLYLVGGTMGVGKTTACRLLKTKLENSVFLDGDWCWDMHPFRVTEQTKKMVMDNICAVLQNFIDCSELQNIVFCWVMHEQSIIDGILSRLDVKDCEVVTVSLVCAEEELRQRLTHDVERGARAAEDIERSVARIALYESLRTRKLDVSALTPEETADAIANM